MGKRYTWAAETHQGHHRSHNEDRYAVFTCPLGEAFVVCDGMGGHAAGDVAATLAVQRIKELLEKASITYPVDYWLRRALHYAHQAIQEYSQQTYGMSYMGTTAVVLLLTSSGEAWWAHTGDSRLYLFREQRLWALTHDHSYVSLLVDAGHLSPEAAFGHPQSNQLLFSLGASQDFTLAEASSYPLSLNKGDVFLLCSDGLSGFVPPEELRSILSAPLTPAEKVRKLISLALQAGGYDNITAIVIESSSSMAISRSFSRLVRLAWILIAWLVGVGSGFFWAKRSTFSSLSPPERTLRSTKSAVEKSDSLALGQEKLPPR
ncbi:MAG: protein phosphatase 2C domain-containing protein [Bacteroidia bacterium]|nr:protein phosphatase 2C domain-containing protein [Bacteroidia bacterium]